LAGVAAEITISRPSAVWRDRLRAYKLVVDGNVVASIGPGKAEAVRVSAGHHRIWVKIDWCHSPMLEIDLEDGGRASFSVRPNGPLVFVLLYVTIFRARYLDLQQN
jgi:hypothetical protein